LTVYEKLARARKRDPFSWWCCEVSIEPNFELARQVHDITYANATPPEMLCCVDYWNCFSFAGPELAPLIGYE
jgi:hypothetical protein